MLYYVIFDLPIMPIILYNIYCDVCSPLVCSIVSNKCHCTLLIDSIYSGVVFHVKVPQSLCLIFPYYPSLSPCSRSPYICLLPLSLAMETMVVTTSHGSTHRSNVRSFFTLLQFYTFSLPISLFSLPFPIVYNY